ncbi:winged helix-turn-helix domain-containing protein [Streptomyces sp. NPDC051985]|uniref:helix-turn-helix domain-containing protein n=1 Tax=Streptomyces sp. NPDC051985 TaxID=3155807 RepID=UPI00343B354B
MQYAQGGGLTPVEQVKREAVRLEAGPPNGSKRGWYGPGCGGVTGDGPVGAPVAVERLSPQQWQRLEAELKPGPLAHGNDDEEQGWTLKRVKLLIGRLFHVGYTVQGGWQLLRRHGWSCQVLVRRELERDEEAIEVWKVEVWPRVKVPRTIWAPTSASRTKAASR